MLKCIEEIPMRAEEWEEIKRIFDSAVKLTPAERGGFLAGACAHNPGLLQTVGELLQAHDEAPGFLDEESAKPPLPPVFDIGQLVAERFRIVRLISRGGMGEVYETFDERLSVRLALKTLRPEYARDVDSLERFRREIRVTREISHPNLCRVYELVEHRLPPEEPGSPGRIATCLTMQLMAGENLQQYLVKSGRLSPTAALPLIKQIAGAIGVLHENGIVHRDLKPSNVMITPGDGGAEMRAIVMDFGLAKPFKGAKEAFESRSDFNAGAPFFLAPELVRGERPSVASDIYAFGLIVDEMVTGGGAFSGDSVEAILYQKLWSDPNDPLTRAPGLPANWCQTIRRCLHRNPAKRPSSAAHVVRELRDIPAETQPVPAFYRAIGKLGGLLPKVSRHPSRLGLLLGACAALFIGGGAFVGILGSRPLNTSVVTFEFENMTGQAENDYLSKGITREVERRLLQIPGVSVMPFHAVRPKDAQLKLGARFSLEGQLQSNKAVTRLSVEVTENASGKLICCANAFENSTADTLEMQSAIATSAVDAMRDAVLLPNVQNAGGGFPEMMFNLLHRVPLPGAQRALAAPTASSAAMQFYMRGRSLWEQRTLTSQRQAIELYRKAIKEDRNFALAYADLSGVESSLLQYNGAPREQLLRSAKEHALLAIAKGPSYAESYAALAVTAQSSWDWRAAEQYYKRALAINPKLSVPHRWYGGFLMQFGKFDDGLSETRTAIALDPFDLEGRLYLGTFLCIAGKPAEAITLLKGFLAEKDYLDGHTVLSVAYAQLAMNAREAQKTEMLNNAMKEAAIVAQSDPGSSEPDYARQSVPLYALLYALRGDRQNALKYLEILQRGVKAGAVNPVDLARSYVALGDSKAALEILSRAVTAKESELLYLKVDSFLQPLRNTVEYRGLISKIGL
jgi:TolB-like protein/Flp pilus assembly protein TadD